MTPLLLIFYPFAALVALCSVMVVASRNPVTSAIFLVLDLFLLAGIYAMMQAHFIAAIQVLIYAGAIVVLFMFVIMLLNLSPESRDTLRIPASELGVLLLTVLGFGVISIMLFRGSSVAPVGDLTPEAVAAAGGNTYTVGMILFTKYLWPFELASILILLAIIASVVIAKKDKSEKSEKDRAALAGKRRPAHAAR